MDARTLASKIMDDDRNASILTNDAGNGCAGPSSITADDLAEMIADGTIDGYAIIDDPATIIADTLKAHRLDIDPASIVLAERCDGDGSNPYRHYLLLWEV